MKRVLVLALFTLLLCSLTLCEEEKKDDDNPFPGDTPEADGQGYKGHLTLPYDPEQEAVAWRTEDIHEEDLAPIKKAGQGMRIPFNYIIILKEGYSSQVVDEMVDRMNEFCKKLDTECTSEASYYNVIKGYHMEAVERVLNETRTWEEVSYVEEDQIFQLEHASDEDVEKLDKGRKDDKSKEKEEQITEKDLDKQTKKKAKKVKKVKYDDEKIDFGRRTMTDEEIRQLGLELSKDDWVDRILDDLDREKMRKVQWNLDRIDQRKLPTDDKYLPEGDGAGVDVYCVGTGVRITHTDFEGRASVFYDALGGKGKDCHGHGTQTCSIVGGKIWGVAKNVTMRAVRVFNCGGYAYTRHLIKAFDVIAEKGKGGVVQMPFLGPKSNVTDLAVKKLFKHGYLTIAPAGNNQGNACYLSPARSPENICVAGLRDDIIDERAIFSNFGACVDVFAPAGKIKGASHRSDKKIKEHAGTSLAVPHVTGVAAIIWGNNPDFTPAEVKEKLLDDATRIPIKYSEGAPEKIVYTSANPEPQLDEGTCDKDSCKPE
ncbi:uncharacterized protein [Ptychodera flava]|uniref:uncharacterized protein n=1 Tax=Ptychodera flava TaxID=63121 RepID=UPI00396A5A77